MWEYKGEGALRSIAGVSVLFKVGLFPFNVGERWDTLQENGTFESVHLYKTLRFFTLLSLTKTKTVRLFKGRLILWGWP